MRETNPLNHRDDKKAQHRPRPRWNGSIPHSQTDTRSKPKVAQNTQRNIGKYFIVLPFLGKMTGF